MDNSTLDNLREKVLFRKKNLKLSASRIASEAGLTSSTFCRFLNGGGLDTDNRLRLGAWIGMTASEIFGHCSVNKDSADTLGEIRALILADASIPESRRKDFCDWFETTYETFKKKNEIFDSENLSRRQ